MSPQPRHCTIQRHMNWSKAYVQTSFPIVIGLLEAMMIWIPTSSIVRQSISLGCCHKRGANAYQSPDSATTGTMWMVRDSVPWRVREVSPAPGVFRQTGPGLGFKPNTVLTEPDQILCLVCHHRLQCFVGRPFDWWRPQGEILILLAIYYQMRWILTDVQAPLSQD